MMSAKTLSQWLRYLEWWSTMTLTTFLSWDTQVLNTVTILMASVVAVNGHIHYCITQVMLVVKNLNAQCRDTRTQV